MKCKEIKIRCAMRCWKVLTIGEKHNTNVSDLVLLEFHIESVVKISL